MDTSDSIPAQFPCDGSPALKEATDHIQYTTGCNYPDAVITALAVLAGIAGPVFRVVTPHGRHLPLSVNLLIESGPHGTEAVRALRAELDNWLGAKISELNFSGEKSLRVREQQACEDYKRSKAALAVWNERRAASELPEFALSAEAIGRKQAEEEERGDLRKWREITFLQRPWITTNALIGIERMRTESFDNSLVINLPDAEQGFAELSGKKWPALSSILEAGYFGSPLSLDPKFHLQPVITNLWFGGIDQNFPAHPIIQSFLRVRLQGDQLPEPNLNSLESWTQLIQFMLDLRLERRAVIQPFSATARSLYAAKLADCRARALTAHPDCLGGYTYLPYQAAKLAGLFLITRMLHAEPADEISGEDLAAGFECAEAMILRPQPTTAKVVQPVDAPNFDLSRILDRLTVSGPMTRRRLLRSFHKLRAPDLERTLAAGVQEGVLIMEGDAIRRADHIVSVSAGQQPPDQRGNEVSARQRVSGQVA
jgi:hypothetical protein